MEMIEYKPAGDKFTNVELYVAAQKFLAKAPDDADAQALSAVRP
jgi:hypothetical protein